MNAVPPRELARFSTGAPVPFDEKGSWNLSFLHQAYDRASQSDVVSLSYSRSLPFDASLFATAFSDFGTNRSTGIVAGLSIPLGDRVSLTSSVSDGQSGGSAMIDAAKSLGSETGDTGWEVRVSDQTSSAEASYRTGYLTAKAGVAQNGGTSSIGVQLRGSISTLGGHVFFSDWIDNSFAVVDAGAPGVDVFYENRPVGKTDLEGMLLVPRSGHIKAT